MSASGRSADRRRAVGRERNLPSPSTAAISWSLLRRRCAPAAERCPRLAPASWRWSPPGLPRRAARPARAPIRRSKRRASGRRRPGRMLPAQVLVQVRRQRDETLQQCGLAPRPAREVERLQRMGDRLHHGVRRQIRLRAERQQRGFRPRPFKRRGPGRAVRLETLPSGQGQHRDRSRGAPGEHPPQPRAAPRIRGGLVLAFLDVAPLVLAERDRIVLQPLGGAAQRQAMQQRRRLVGRRGALPIRQRPLQLVLPIRNSRC